MLRFFLLCCIGSVLLDAIELSREEKLYLQNKPTITMCVDPSWPPFEEIIRNKHVGIAADFIELIQKRLDITITLVPTQSWDESLAYSQNRKCDLLSFLNATPKREEWLLFSDVLLEDPNVIISRNEYPSIEDLSQERASIALPSGTAMMEIFEKKYPNLLIVPVETEKEAFELVESKNVDLTLRSLIISAYTIKKEGLFNLKIAAKPSEHPNKLRIGIHKEEPLLRDILNKAIATITQKDRDAIINRHVAIVINEVKYITIGVWIFLTLAFLSMLVIIHNAILKRKVAIEVAKNLAQEKLLHQKNKKEELGELIASISHQWRDGLNKIAYINLEKMMKLKLNKPVSKEEFLKSSEEIEESITFMSKTMQDFLDFYKPSTHVSSFDVKESIEAALNILDTKIKQHNAHIEIIELQPTTLKAIKSEWIHIWLNLVNNSLNQIRKQGIKMPLITIKLAHSHIFYYDNCGTIEPHILAQLQNQTNDGLGVKIIHGILKKSGWVLEIRNSDIGAVFEIKRMAKFSSRHR